MKSSLDNSSQKAAENLTWITLKLGQREKRVVSIISGMDNKKFRKGRKVQHSIYLEEITYL